MNTKSENTECCPKLDPSAWEDKIFEWDNKKFIKSSVLTFLYMPVNFGKVITRMIQKVEKSGATMPDNLCLSDHTSKFNMDLYLAVDKEIEDAENKSFTGKYYSRVYEGDFNKTGEWCKDFEKTANDKGMQVKKWYMWYTTCPKCAKKYGKNYVVIIAEV
jgi:hypothetical protein